MDHTITESSKTVSDNFGSKPTSYPQYYDDKQASLTPLSVHGKQLTYNGHVTDKKLTLNGHARDIKLTQNGHVGDALNSTENTMFRNFRQSPNRDLNFLVDFPIVNGSGKSSKDNNSRFDAVGDTSDYSSYKNHVADIKTISCDLPECHSPAAKSFQDREKRELFMEIKQPSVTGDINYQNITKTNSGSVNNTNSSQRFNCILGKIDTRVKQSIGPDVIEDKERYQIPISNVTDGSVKKLDTFNNIYSNHFNVLDRKNELQLENIQQPRNKQNCQYYRTSFEESLRGLSKTEEQNLEAQKQEVVLPVRQPLISSESLLYELTEFPVSSPEEPYFHERLDERYTRRGLVPEEIDDFTRLRSEIIVHEVDTLSEAGSEDVELIPHRYESQSSGQKHIYVNRLSLAVELLRTKEALPYDEEFKPLPVADGKQENEAGTMAFIEDYFCESPREYIYSAIEGEMNPAFIDESQYEDYDDPVFKLNAAYSYLQSDVFKRENLEKVGRCQPTITNQVNETLDNTTQSPNGYTKFGTLPRQQAICPDIRQGHFPTSCGPCCVTM
ncbi:uncharacterized protein LOC106464717 [Limulus polyphemus]|uniref:Uncharacterized protein LOC106464717 n=1 Tax=Limulus polyphemus TaxID=6850 RepID=A0ABM1BEF5_LIMPO|nr:uncharacterized protein LOC106464717 [Limulus polyphemus]